MKMEKESYFAIKRQAVLVKVKLMLRHIHETT